MSNYLSISPGKAVKWSTISGGDKTMKVVDTKDIPESELPQSFKDVEKECWKLDVDDKYCVDDLDSKDTILVQRKNPIYHTRDATVYAFCCGAGYECEGDGGSRCSYFIYDHCTGVDFYIDDQMEWTSDEQKIPVFLIPALSEDDNFNNNRQNVTTEHPPTTPHGPPSGNCSGWNNFFFYFKGVFG
ncbi:unnamed protein product [Bursaphelenchus okinawaensis]|uniref:Uncharacterized protein n=1 Tax=Bursaphelenchus okinawaensis TaxID=465554 RepID=A0A811KFG6_9BILA|nr:unnamed protein product [Bursaphelenchus okinawaensis]CAG9102366.1 unnamed protein product [Bursaphelenchus okinawaensis]